MGYCTEQILIQFAIGFSGSLLAGTLIAIISERRFNRAIKSSGNLILDTVKPLNRITFTIANEIKTLSQVVDKLREGLEKRL